MTNTTIYNAVALGTTTEKIGASPTKTTLQTGTTAVVLNVKLVGAKVDNNPSDATRLYYAISPFSLTADATLPFLLRPQCGILEIKPRSEADQYEVTGVIANNGGNLYTWFDSPAYGSGSPTITLVSVELP